MPPKPPVTTLASTREPRQPKASEKKRAAAEDSSDSEDVIAPKPKKHLLPTKASSGTRPPAKTPATKKTPTSVPQTTGSKAQRTTILSEEEDDLAHEDAEIIEVDISGNIKQTTVPEKAEEDPEKELGNFKLDKLL